MPSARNETGIEDNLSQLELAMANLEEEISRGEISFDSAARLETLALSAQQLAFGTPDAQTQERYENISARVQICTRQITTHMEKMRKSTSQQQRGLRGYARTLKD